MNFIIRATIILILAFVGISFSHDLIKKNNPAEVVEEESSSHKVKRRPASVSDSRFGKPVSQTNSRNFKVSSVLESSGNFNQNSDGSSYADSEVDSTNHNGTGNFNSFSPIPSSPESRRFQNSSVSGVGAKSGVANKSGTLAKVGNVFTFSNVGRSAVTPENTDPVQNSAIEPPSSSSSGGSDTITCSTSMGGGAFGNPIQVSLSCSTAANIKYCLQEGSCCDPVVSGTVYSAPIVIGEDTGNYCLSFYGKKTASKFSEVTQQTYAISNTYPDLQISFPKIYYQTTQLSGYNLLRSNDFSKTDYLIGEINLKSHDPGPSGLNLDCQDIVETYVTLPAPAPTVIFNPLDMSGIAFGAQLNVPLVLSKLDYGENFLTSYVVNDNFASPLYSCSTNKVTLLDFEFFASEISHAETGTNSVREFSGSFVPYSFFEANADVNRTPAGLASEEVTGQELRVGSFGVFY